MATTIKTRSLWKSSKIDPRLLANFDTSGFVGLQELTDYELVAGDGISTSPTSRKNARRRKKKTVKVGKVQGEMKEDTGTLDQGELADWKIRSSRRDSGGNSAEDMVLTDSKMATCQTRKRKKKKETQLNSTSGMSGKVKTNNTASDRVISGAQVVDIAEDETILSPGRKPRRKRKLLRNDTPLQPSHKKMKKDKPEKKKLTTSSKDEKRSDNSQEPVTLSEMSDWRNLYVPKPVLKSLAELEFMTPTPIQALVLPSAIRDHMDVVGAAETGSGKTLAFGIPLIHTILKHTEQQLKGEMKAEIEEEEEEEEERTIEVESENEEDLREDVEIPFIIDMGDSLPGGHSKEEEEEEEEDSNDEDYDLSPDEEELEELEESQTGCVKVVNDVNFDWLNEGAAKPQQPIKPLYALVLTPTRELAIQVRDHIQAVARHANIKVAAVVGGMAAQKQERLLKKGPEIVVATPGRLWELIQEGEPHLSQVENIRCLVIDEADRMVEKGHFEELSKLLLMINANEEKRRRRQTFVFSATLTLVHQGPDRMLKKKKKKKKQMTSEEKLDALVGEIGIKQRHKVVDLSRKEGTAEHLTEARINCQMEEKDYYLYYMLQQYPARTLVFANSKDCIRRLMSVCKLLQVCPLALHADMHQKQRLKNLDRFKGNPRGLLLATDVAARGLDIPNVQHVIHYQVPRTTENYVHRSGRTARASKEGLSVMFVGPEDLKNYRKIIKTLNREEELALFPVESSYMTGVKQRVNLARDIDTMSHRVDKKKAENNWFERSAREMDIELDRDLLSLNDLGDSREQAEHRQKLEHLKGHLKVMLSQPLIPQSFSGRYPTKTGKLLMPYIHQPAGGDAVKRVQEERKMDRQLLAKHHQKHQTSQQQKQPLKQTKRNLKKLKFKKSRRPKLNK